MTKHAHGFTVIEILFVAVLIGAASVLFFVQKHHIEVMAHDDMKKVSINAMYYSLEEVFYPANKYYPQTISSDNLKSIDPALFTDPEGFLIDTAGSAYTYSPTNCTDNKCKGYTLKSTLENEGDFVKTSKNN
ncbi:MAG TPA: type II secretion system protein [Candidatus Angelobacter sp.]|nr:type II secretion system protein [Candidatus Angelobacter sp.]